MSAKELIAEIDAFLAGPGLGMAETAFGKMAVNDGKFVSDLRGGRRVWPETVEKVRSFMRAHPGSAGAGQTVARAS